MPKKKLTPDDYHEAADRLYVQMDSMQNYIADHQVFKHHKDWSKRLDKALAILFDLYQEAGNKMFEDK